MIKDDIELNLKNNLEIYFLEVINESNMHNTPDGAESHFKITVVSDSVSYTHLTLPTNREV